MIRFAGVNGDIPQMEIVNSDTTPMQGVNLTVSSTTFLESNQKILFFEPVPFEFIHTAETKPQVLVSVDGVEAVCHSLNCGFKYIEPTA